MADGGAFERPSAAKEMPTIVIIGDAIMDVQVSGLAHLPDWGKDRECQAVGLLPGGSAANVARQLGSIGAGECSVALTGHTFSQGASSHCTQATGWSETSGLSMSSPTK